MTDTAESHFKIEDRNHTVAEVAKIFSVSEQTVRIWINQGDSKKRKLGAIKVGKKWLVSRQAMIDWANGQYESGK